MTTQPSTAERPDNPVRKRRKARGLTQSQLAEIVGCDQTMVSAIELGTAKPSMQLAQALATHLGASLDELFGEAVA